jgi:transketolase
VLLRRNAGDRFIFLTGDVGFRALEPLRDLLGERFINCGIAEQNMISVAAGLSKGGMDVWVYTIAPFCYARPFEQIRNGLNFHRLPVKLIGNGGGYGYGVMGPTHHALEDCGVLLTLQWMRVYVPAFDEDIAPIVESMSSWEAPSYLRLGLDERPEGVPIPPYGAWRRVMEGEGGVLIALGPIVSQAILAVRNLPPTIRPEVWVVTELPFDDLPDSLTATLMIRRRLCVIEEHVGHGGLGSMICLHLARLGCKLAKFIHLHALGYISGLYGSQKFHRKESCLDISSIQNAIEALGN